jgi:hypothetical protein
MHSPEEIASDFVRVNMGSYLTGTPGCDLEWMKLIINLSDLNPGDLADIFIEMDGFGDNKRYRKLLKVCRKVAFHPDAIL